MDNVKPINNSLGDSFKSRLKTINHDVANIISKTMGPYGHNVIIQNLDSAFMTKDGWTVLQNIQYDDITDKALKSLIENVAFSTNLKVGDGTTTSTVAADILNDSVEEIIHKFGLNIRDTETYLTNTVDAICVEIEKQAAKIDTEFPKREIKDIALVSSNWDEELSEIVSEIYNETKNPIIKVVDSGTDETYVTYIEGYDLVGELLCPNYTINNIEKNIFESKNPVVLVFGHTVPKSYLAAFHAISAHYSLQNRPFVIMAPNFENDFAVTLNYINLENMKQKLGPVNIIPIKVKSMFNIDRECIQDFCYLTGATIITAHNEDVKECIDEVVSLLSTKASSFEDEEEQSKFVTERSEIIFKASEFLRQLAGTCETITADNKSVVGKGFNNAQEQILATRKRELQSQIGDQLKKFDAMTCLTDDVRMKKVRYGKLQGKMGVINVGGYGSAYIKAKKDAIEDTIKACEAAYLYGYNISTIINVPYVIDCMMKDRTFDKITKAFLHAIRNCFFKIFEIIIDNKGKYFSATPNDIEIDALPTEPNLLLKIIFEKCIEEDTAFDIVNNEYSDSIINPCTVDIEVLKGCLRLLLINHTSDQMLMKKYSSTSNN